MRSLAVAFALAGTLSLGGCATVHRWTHRTSVVGCREVPFNGSAENLPPLQVPEGMSAPDTTGAIKVPTLKTAEQPRPKGAPCLDAPPDYGSAPTGLPARRPS